MIVSVTTSALKETKWHEYAIRFVLGGLVTTATGLIAKKFGPGVGGLFLAYPAIFPASATLIEKHERERKEEKGLVGVFRARAAAGADAAGAAMGAIGMITFACCVAWWLPVGVPAVIIGSATVVWALVSALVWIAWKRHLFAGLKTIASQASRWTAKQKS
jgi:hypothetical protein